MDKKMLNTESATFEILDDVLFVTYKSGLIITLQRAKEIVESRLAFIELKSYPVLIDITEVKSIDKDARDYFSSDQGTGGIQAAVFLINSVFSKFFANFFMKITVKKPVFPVRIFNDKAKALKWLEEHRK